MKYIQSLLKARKKNRNGSKLSRGLSRSVSRVVSRKRIVVFAEQRCPVLDRPRTGLSAIMEKHRQEDPGNEIATGECWVLLNSGIAVTRDTIDVGAANENADMASCSVPFKTGKFVFFLLYLIRSQSKSNEPNRTEFQSIQSTDCIRIEPNR